MQVGELSQHSAKRNVWFETECILTSSVGNVYTARGDIVVGADVCLGPRLE